MIVYSHQVQLIPKKLLVSVHSS